MTAARSLLALLAMTSVAHAERVVTVPTTPPEPVAAPTATVVVPGELPLTAAAVRDAPLPGAEHGRTDPVDTGDGLARKLGRALLLIPRIPIELVAQPARGWFYLQDHYDILRVIEAQFQTEDQKVTIYPTALFETGFGLNVGARARFKDLFGGGERIAMRAAIGGQFKRVAALDVETRGRLRGGLELRYEVAQDHFFGYGNGKAVPMDLPIDPLTSDASVASDFRTRMFRIAPSIKFHLTPALAVTATGALIDKSFAPTDGVPVTEAFDVTRLPGFERGTRFVYDELQVAWDTRRSATVWDPLGVRDTGTLLLGFVGRQDGLHEAEPSFYRVGFDLQRYLRLTQGPRVLELRAFGEMVTGPRDEVPFSELPRLGGSALLRGYDADRFRDRVVVVAQASYMWAAAEWLAPSLFVDVGRVYAGLDELSFHHPRVGYGAALEVYESQGMLMRLQVASSLDGGAFVYLTFNPVFDPRSRVERH